MTPFIMALDQGTTSSRAIIFSPEGTIVASAHAEFPQLLPAPAIVEHNPEDIWASQLSVAQQAIQRAGIDPRAIRAIGVTNQRETTILWERTSGRPIANAIVWQSRISAPICHQLKADGWEPQFREKTGLILDPYFSATKIRYLLDSYDGLQQRAERGEILFGTVDSFLIWRLTAGRHHVTDPSNASRTLLFNLHTCDWDEDLLAALRIPRAMLPTIVPSSHWIGDCEPKWFGHAVPICGCIGDQQAATFGQTCFQRGDAKCTYGTGCFLLMTAGNQPVPSRHQLLTTVGWQIDNQVVYCLEGSVFIAGAVVQWLRDGLGIIRESKDVEALAASVSDSGGVYFVPAFVGLGVPYWDPRARGAILGMTRGTTAGHIARAALDAIAFQTCDLVDALRQDIGCDLTTLQVDGGSSVNNDLMQLQADLLGVPIRRPIIAETTALGAAFLAGLAVGVWPGLPDLKQIWSLDREFQPRLSAPERESRIRRWHAAVDRTREWDDAGPPTGRAAD